MAGSKVTLVAQLRDAADNTLTTDSTTQASVTIQEGPAGAHMTGTTTVTAAAGVLTWSNLVFDVASFAYKLNVTAAGVWVVTDAFTITRTYVGRSMPACLSVAYQWESGMIAGYHHSYAILMA
jgi:hypothetical protein